MFFDILKRDLKRKKTMNIIILLFVILAVMFIASSANNLVAVTTSLDNYFDKAGVGDFIAAERSGGTYTVKEAVKNVEGVKKFKQEECIFLSDYMFNGREKTQDDQTATMSFISCLSNQIENYFDGNNSEITKVGDGEAYVRQSVLDSNGAKIGDTVTLTLGDVSRSLTIKGILKDALFGSRLMGNARFLVSDNDYRVFEKSDNIEPYKFYISFINADDTSALQSELGKCDAVSFSGDRGLIRTTYIMEMIVAGILLVVSAALIIIAVVILRFTIGFTLSEEFRQIGIMKAIGIPNAKIRSLYLVKYLSIAIVGAAVGIALSFPFGNILLQQVSQSIVMESSNGVLLGFGCALAVVALILLFCWISTRKVKKFTPVDAIRSGATGERYKKKGIIRLGKKRVNPLFFMAVNDILSGVKRFGIMLVTFFVGVSILLVVLNVSTTMKSGKLLDWMSMARCDAAIVENHTIEKYMVDDGREKLNARIDQIEADIKAKGWDADCFVETLSSLNVEKDGVMVKTCGIEGIGITPDKYTYIEGTAPQNKSEVALSYIVAEKINAEIGDTIKVITSKGTTQCTVTAIYQSMMNIGDNIRLYPGQSNSFRHLSGLNDFQVRFNDNPGESEISSRIETLRGMYSDAKIMTSGEYVDYCVGGVGGIMESVAALLLPIIILIDILVAVLMEKSFLAKERGEIAMLKAIGFKNRSIILWQTLRIGIVMVLATLLSIALANPIGQLTTGGIFQMMGAKTVVFSTDVFKTCILYPAIILAATVVSVALAAMSVRKVNSNEISSIE